MPLGVGIGLVFRTIFFPTHTSFLTWQAAGWLLRAPLAPPHPPGAVLAHHLPRQRRRQDVAGLTLHHQGVVSAAVEAQLRIGGLHRFGTEVLAPILLAPREFGTDGLAPDVLSLSYISYHN